MKGSDFQERVLCDWEGLPGLLVGVCLRRRGLSQPCSDFCDKRRAGSGSLPGQERPVEMFPNDHGILLPSSGVW